MTVKELKKKRNAVVLRLKKLHEENTDSWGDDEEKQYQAGKEEKARLDAAIERAEEIEADAKVAAEEEAYENRKAAGAGEKPEIEVGEKRETLKPWKNFGEQLQAVRAAASPEGRIDDRLLRLGATDLGESVPSDGGFLVQTDFSTELLKRMYDTGVLASRCRRIPLSSNANGITINGIDETSRADGSRYGGVRAYWTDEAATYTSSQPKFRQISLKLNKLTGLCYATDELLQDTSALQSVITDAFVDEFGFKMDDAIVNGDGAGKPLGLMNAACKVQVSKETGQAAATVLAENLEKMYARMWPRSMNNAVWFINQEVWPQLFQLHHAVGTGGVPVFVPGNSLNNAPFGTLLGRPIVPIEQCQALGTAGDVIFADLSQYLLVDKQSMASAMSVHVRFLYDETAFKFTYRVDGQPIWNAALTPYKGSATLSPIVVLATRS